jgi:ORF6N domain
MTQEAFTPKIYVIRNEPVMLDSDLALLYGVTTGNFNKAINRNEGRFPSDFSFVLTRKELPF